MAFEPVPGQYYRIVPKHSGKTIGTKDKLPHMGTNMTQLAPDANGHPSQEFLIERFGDYYQFVVRQNNQTQNIAVLGSRQEDDSDVGQWDRNDSWNQQFLLLPGGDGTYYISPHHSQQFLCVKGGETKDGASLVQHVWTGGDHFRFSFVPVSPVKPRAQREPALRGADPLREAALGLVGLIPEVGGGAKFIVSHLWNDGPSLIDQMRDYVTAIAQGLIDQEFIKGLEEVLEGMKNNFVQYATSTAGADKGTWMTSVISALETAQPKFFDKRLPQRTLTHLLTFGTMHLLMLRERYDKFEQIYGKKPQDPKELSDQLKAGVAKYSTRATTAREQTLNWRMGHIYAWSENVRTTGSSSYEVFYARDDYTGWRFAADRRDQNIDQRRALRDGVHAEYTRIAREQFTAELDGLFTAASGWRYLNPEVTAKPQLTPVVVKSPLYGSATGTYFDTGADPALGNRIDEVTMWLNDSENRVVGLEIQSNDYNRKTKAGRESEKRGGRTYRNEEIVGAYGNSADHPAGPLSSLYLVTRSKHIGGRGQRATGTPFASEPPLEKGCLHSIYGYATDDQVHGIGFRWSYARHE
ncbi:MAG TPA: RICIN domain-containing protein [Thermoanaerobaculia bacterium]